MTDIDRRIVEEYKKILASITQFSKENGIKLRGYQQQAAEAIAESVIQREGRSFAIIFPRQSGKNELQAQLEAYFLCLGLHRGNEMVKVSPTWKPQSQNAMRRLERVLKRSLISCDNWKKRSGYIYQFGESMIYFLSGSPTTSIVGATASLLLECDEAQDVQIAKWDKEIAPMAASTNATRVFWGTAWTSKTLLARELRAARLQEKQDGIRRTWVLTADDVGKEVPAYKQFVEEQVARLGRNNPLIRTQYFSEEIDAEGGMFPLGRRLLMYGRHDPQVAPLPGHVVLRLRSILPTISHNGTLPALLVISCLIWVRTPSMPLLVVFIIFRDINWRYLMTTSFMALLTNCLVSLGDPDASTWSRTDIIIPWAKEAMLAFPVLRPMEKKVTIEATGHLFTLPDGFREIITVEFPSSQEPPVFLNRMNHLDPSFYLTDTSYDIERDFPDGTGWVCWFSRRMIIGDEIVINYLANHETDLEDESSSYITIPDEYVPIIVQYVVCKGYRERLGAYMQDPTAHTTIIQQMYEMVQHAEDRYQQMVDQAVARYSDSRRSPHMHVDKFDRVY
jgi:hypothetical protein